MSLLYTGWLLIAVLLLVFWLVRLAVMALAERQRLFLASRSCPHRHDASPVLLSAQANLPATPRSLSVVFGAEDASDSTRGSLWPFRTGGQGRKTVGGTKRLVVESFDPWPRVSIIVAAKDEEANIHSCVESLLDQDYPCFELIVVDDRSTDRTAAIVESLRASHAHGERLKLIRVRSLPDGWYGKHHAMKVGVESAKGTLICFIDADCRQTSPCTLWTAVARLMSWQRPAEQPIDFLTIIPRLELLSAWDRLVQPLLAIQVMAWFPPFLVNHPRTRTAYANGMFMLMRRACYREIGGMDAARHVANEDIRLAELTKWNGYRLHVVENEDLYVSRMYRTPRESMRGWSRIFCGALKARWKIALCMASWTLTVILPFLSLVLATGGLLLGRAGWPAFVLWGSIYVLMVLGAVRIYRWFQVPWTHAFALPLLACPVLIVLGHALAQTMGLVRTHWRGTAYTSVNSDLQRRRAA